MVAFICDACGQTVKKNRVEKHYQSECRSCSILSCIDCGKDFPGESYAEHTSCITEAEKYQGKLYKPKEKGNKGEVKQQEWIKQVQLAGAGTSDPKLKSYMKRISDYSNVPRKKGKFENFCKNSLKVYDQNILEKLWELFSSQLEKPKPIQVSETTANETKQKQEDVTISNGDTVESEDHQTKEDDVTEDSNNKRKTKENKNKKNKIKDKNNEDEVNGEKVDAADNKKKKKRKRKCDQDDESLETKKKKFVEDDESLETRRLSEGKFDWKKVIKEVLKDAPEEGISIKRLRKKVLGEYETFGKDHRATSKVECYALFDKKLHSSPKAKLFKDRVIYRK